MAIPGIHNVSVQEAMDGFGRPPAEDPEENRPHSYLDSEKNRTLLGKLENWWAEARDAATDNRREQMKDADYIDGIQWSAADAAVLIDRGQAPLNTALLKQVIDWVTGTERRTRVDWDVLPRKDADVKTASVKKDVLKWVSDINGSPWERSQQFADQVSVGVGWIEDCVNNDRFEEKLTNRHQDWKEMWWDPYSRSNTLRDCRYLHRAKFLDLDYAIAMMPDRKDELERLATNTLDASMEIEALDDAMPMMFYGLTPTPSRGITTAFGTMSSNLVVRHPRKRVLVIETWFKKATNVPMLMGDGTDDVVALNGKPFNPHDQGHQNALATGAVTLVDGVTEEMWVALWTPGALLRINRSPYKHKKFPFTPAWATRRHRDGMPYGIARQTRDAIDEFNKRRSKILFDLSTNQLFYESDAWDEADEQKNLEEAKRPDGEVRLASGGLEKYKIERAEDRVAAQIQMLQLAKDEVYEASGVTRENTGTSRGDQSGRAILAKQQQGAVTTATLFDNFRQAFQESGQKQLSNCEQFLTMEKVIRVVGPDNAVAWVTINQPRFDPLTGGVLWDNDITASEADFIIDETDFRETVRMALSEMMFEMIGKLPPDYAVALLDIAVDMTDLPNKKAWVDRIRKLNGQTPPGKEDDPEVQAMEAERQQAQQEAQQREQAALDAKTRLTNEQAGAAHAKATLDDVRAKREAVTGKADAMNTAGMVHASPNLAPAADKIWDPAAAFPMPPEQFIPET